MNAIDTIKAARAYGLSLPLSSKIRNASRDCNRAVANMAEDVRETGTSSACLCGPVEIAEAILQVKASKPATWEEADQRFGEILKAQAEARGGRCPD